MWQHCLQSVVPLPLQCCMPLECCSTASQHCSAASGLQQHCLWTAAALLLDSDTAFPMRQHCLQLVAAMPAHGSGIAFTAWQHCLQTVMTLPVQCCMPLECCSTASQHCSAASGLQQQCLSTAAALLLDRDTAFPMRQHCLQLVAAMPAHGSGIAFTAWQHCLQTVVTLPLQCCMPLECRSTASQHCSAASGLQQQCLWTAAALLLDSDTAFPMRQHCLQLVAAMPAHGSRIAFTAWQHCLQTVVTLPLQCCMPLECCSTASQHCSAASGLQQQCLWTAAALLLDRDTAFPMRQHCLQLAAVMPAHGSGIAFTAWRHCLQTVVPLPLQCCMPLECCSTASQHCSAASGLQQQCLWTAAALLLGRDTAFPMRQHGLQLVAYLHTASQHCSSASGLQHHCLQNVAALPCG